MSIIRAVMRMCAVAALRERTWAAERVYDSDNTPLAEALLNTSAKPYIVVYTDADSHTEISGRDIYSSARAVDLTLEIGIASSTRLVEDGEITLTIPATDQGMEAAVDIVESQALAALIGDPRSQWGELFKGIVNSVARVPSVRGGSAQAGTRYAARRIILVCDTISDPAPGVVLYATHPIKQFITMATAAGGELADAANIIDKVLTVGAYTTWEQAQAWLGLTEAGIRATGIAPYSQQDIDEHTEGPIVETINPLQAEWVDPTTPPVDDPYD